MTVFHTKSAAITSADAVPVERVTRGRGNVARVVTVEAFATPTASAGIDTTVQMVRVPWTAIVKSVEVKSAAQDTTGQFDIGVYHASDLSNSLSKATLLAADAVDADFFATGAQFDPGGVKAYIRSIPGGAFSIINATPALIDNAAWAPGEANKPLWEAAGLTTAPGGNADICLTVVEAPGAATVPIFMRVEYVE